MDAEPLADVFSAPVRDWHWLTCVPTGRLERRSSVKWFRRLLHRAAFVCGRSKMSIINCARCSPPRDKVFVQRQCEAVTISCSRCCCGSLQDIGPGYCRTSTFCVAVARSTTRSRKTVEKHLRMFDWTAWCLPIKTSVTREAAAADLLWQGNEAWFLLLTCAREMRSSYLFAGVNVTVIPFVFWMTSALHAYVINASQRAKSESGR